MVVVGGCAFSHERGTLVLIGLSRSMGNETLQHDVLEQCQATCVLELVAYSKVQRTLFVPD